MNCVELMYFIHGSSIENNAIIAQTLYEQKIDGKQLVNAPDLQSLTEERIIGNICVYDFELIEEDMRGVSDINVMGDE